MGTYFIEVAKMSGAKTYFGNAMEEIFYPVEMLNDEWGFKTYQSAQHHEQEVRVQCTLMGVAVL